MPNELLFFKEEKTGMAGCGSFLMPQMENNESG